MDAPMLFHSYDMELLKLACEVRKLGILSGEIPKVAIINTLYQEDQQNFNFQEADEATMWLYAQLFAQNVTYEIYSARPIFLGESFPKLQSQLLEMINQRGLSPNNLQATIDVFYNFLFYLDNSGLYLQDSSVTRFNVLPIDFLFRARISSYLSGMTPAVLVQLLGPKYQGAKDHGSLLFAAITGFSVHISTIENINSIINSQRYQLIKRYPAYKINRIISVLYRQDVISRQVSNIPLHIFLTMKPESQIEKILIFENDKNIRQLLDKYGMVIPPLINQNYLSRLFYNNIKDYESILSRPVGSPPPLPLYNVTVNYIETRLNIYTPAEIIQAYDLKIYELYDLPGLWNIIKTLVEETR